MSNGDSERIVSDDGSGEATAAYVARRLRELAVEADDVIASAASAADRSPADLHEIYREAWWELHLRLGDGAIGPATAAAAPLLSEKQSVLATRLGISEGIRDRFDWSVGRELPNLGPIGRDIETNAAPIFWSEPTDETTLREIGARLMETGETTVELARRFPPAMSLARFEEAMGELADAMEERPSVRTTGRYRVILSVKR